jgi:hypothetical protein
MNNSSMLLRSLVIYAIILPLAIFLGYMLAGPLTWTSFGTVAGVIAILVFPIFLRFHHPWMIFGWNATMIVFFLPGAPKVWLPLVAGSLVISIARRAVDQRFRFISVPELTWPLVFLVLVILLTAKATGGIGLRSMGGNVYGGKRYFFLLGAIFGYFALVAHRIPNDTINIRFLLHRIPFQRSNVYISLFLLGGLTSLIGDIALRLGGEGLTSVFMFFPPSPVMEAESGLVRLASVNAVCTVICLFLLANFGIRELFSLRRPFWLALFVVSMGASLLGGFRSALIALGLAFTLQFYLEGLHRSKLLPAFFLCGVMAAVVGLPFVKHMPYSVQRTLSFLPIDVDPIARMDAESSSEWRLNIWKAVVPQIPKYFFLGKGLALTQDDFAFSLSTFTGTMQETSSEDNWAALSGDYHSGPLSVIIPFGIWGVIGVIWFFIAGTRVLYKNYKYGDSSLRVINSFLLAGFVTKIVIFLFVFGGFYGDMQAFIGYLAMSVCLNGGVARLADETAPEKAPADHVTKLPARPRPVLGRPATV